MSTLLRVFFGGLVVSVVACGSTPPPPPPPPTPIVTPPPLVITAPPPPLATPDAPFRQQAPVPDGKVQFVAPKIVEAKLKNGLRVLISERHDLPIVSAPDDPHPIVSSGLT